jgi:hypothetical protein
MDPESWELIRIRCPNGQKTVYHPLIVEEKERKINENIKNFSR